MPQKSRAARVMQLIRELQQHVPSLCMSQESNPNTNLVVEIELEFLPAVAAFGFYKDEEGKKIKYLASVDFYGEDATKKNTESLLPYFDEGVDGESTQAAKTEDEESFITNAVKKNSTKLFSGISGVFLGPGLHEAEDVARIGSFLATISNNSMPMEVIQPNKEYSSMKEELTAFKAMSDEEKEEASRTLTLGPGKMAKFTVEFAVRLVEQRLQLLRDAIERTQQQQTLAQEAAATVIKENDNESPEVESFIDPERVRFSCRKCRTILFGENDLEDPPHSQAQHNFSARKLNHGGRTATPASICQSYFLREGVARLGAMSDIEGRIMCPKCSTKMGNWHWSGAQCSCGTWVVPAIQVPKSKVDEIAPSPSGKFPEGTVISPFARLAQAQNLAQSKQES